MRRFGCRDRLLVPLLPSAGLIAGDQQHRVAHRVEDEQDPHLAGTARSRSQLFEVVQPRPRDPVSQRPAERRAVIEEMIDRLRDEPLRDRVTGAQRAQPVTDLPCHHHLVRHRILLGDNTIIQQDYCYLATGLAVLAHGVGDSRRGSGKPRLAVSGT